MDQVENINAPSYVLYTSMPTVLVVMRAHSNAIQFSVENARAAVEV